VSTITRILASLAVVGALVATLSGAGTFATFNAQTTNAANTFAAGTVAMTNVAGSAVSGSNCSSETYAATCATLFALSGLRPGASDSSNTVTVTYTGTLATGDFRLFAGAYESKSASSPAVCTAADPATKVNIQVKAGSTVIYPTSGSGYGTLAAFAASYTTGANGLQLKGGTNGSGTAGVWSANDSGTYTINVNLDGSADNTYQGCRSAVSLNWYASQ
jgi:hypothetical protein